MGSLNYDKARGVLLAAGVALFGLIALTAFVRDVDGVEVVAALMYAPILAALLSFGSTGGLVMGFLAAGVYIGLRLPAIELVGFAPIAGTLMSRVLGYVAFGGLGGWAADQIRGALDRYQLIDEVDESSGLGNARSVLNALARESSRAKRYASPFSVVTSSFDDLGQTRRARNVLTDLGRKVASSIRDADHAAHVHSNGTHRIIVVLPETGSEGAETVRMNLDNLVRGVVKSEVSTTSITDDGGESDPMASLTRELTS